MREFVRTWKSQNNGGKNVMIFHANHTGMSSSKLVTDLDLDAKAVKADDAEIRKELWNGPAIEAYPFEAFDKGEVFQVSAGSQYVPKDFDPDKGNVVCLRNQRYCHALHDKFLDGLRIIGLRWFRIRLVHLKK